MKLDDTFLDRFVLVLVGFSLATYAVILTTHLWWPDFTVFHTAAQFAMVDPKLIYDDEAMRQAQLWLGDDGPRPWAYPPSALLQFLPFAPLPFPVAYTVYLLLTFGFFLWVARPYAGSAWPLLLASSPVLYAAWSGQTSFLVGGLILAGLARLPRLSGGVLLGIAAALKPQLLVLAPLCMIAAGHYRALAGSIVGGAGVGLASFALGPSLWLDWLDALPRFVETVRSMDILNRAVTPTGFLWNLGLPAWPVVVPLGALTIYAAWTIFRRSDDKRLQAIVLIGGGLWFSPYAMNYELAMLAPMAAYYAMNGPFKSRLMSIPVVFMHGVAAPMASFLFMGFHLARIVTGSRNETLSTLPADLDPGRDLPWLSRLWVRSRSSRPKAHGSTI